MTRHTVNNMWVALHAALQGLYPSHHGIFEIERCGGAGERYRVFGLRGTERILLTLTPQVLYRLSPQFLSNGRVRLPGPDGTGERLILLQEGQEWNDVQPDLLHALRSDPMTPVYELLWYRLNYHFNRDTFHPDPESVPVTRLRCLPLRSASLRVRRCVDLLYPGGEAQPLCLTIIRSKATSQAQWRTGLRVHDIRGNERTMPLEVLGWIRGMRLGGQIQVHDGFISETEYQKDPARYAAPISESVLAVLGVHGSVWLTAPYRSYLPSLPVWLQEFLPHDLKMLPGSTRVGSVWLRPVKESKK